MFSGGDQAKNEAWDEDRNLSHRSYAFEKELSPSRKETFL